MRKNPSTATWVAVGAGVVVAGGLIYFFTRPKAATVTPAAATAPAPQLTQAQITELQAQAQRALPFGS